MAFLKSTHDSVSIELCFLLVKSQGGGRQGENKFLGVKHTE